MPLQSTGTSDFEYTFDPPIKFTGPGIIKIQAMASANDIEGESGFDVILETN